MFLNPGPFYIRSINTEAFIIYLSMAIFPVNFVLASYFLWVLKDSTVGLNYVLFVYDLKHTFNIASWDFNKDFLIMI